MAEAAQGGAREAAEALIERILSRSRIPSRAVREDLRCELRSHFESAGDCPEGLARALRAFGSEDELVGELRRVYRRDYLLVCFARIAGSLVLSIAAALLIQLLVNLRVGMPAALIALAPGFPRSAAMAVTLVIGLATAREALRRPIQRTRLAGAAAAAIALYLLVDLLFAAGREIFAWSAVILAVGAACSRLRAQGARVLLSVCAIAVALCVLHDSLSVALAFPRALVTSASIVAVWASTLAILARVDHLFLRRYCIPEGDPR